MGEDWGDRTGLKPAAARHYLGQQHFAEHQHSRAKK
jgi:hypothetical protein